jgi:hypothetical protein
MAHHKQSSVEILFHRSFQTSLADMYRAGGEPKRRAEKVNAMLGALQTGVAALSDYPITNHGESRIKHCKKYDLGSGFRLITVQTEKVIGLMFVGDHAAADRWLTGNSGLTIGRDRTGTWNAIPMSEVGALISRPPAGEATKLLLDRLASDWHDQLMEGVPYKTVKLIEQLPATAPPVSIEHACNGIPDTDRRCLVYDVLCLLSAGDRAAAESRLDLASGAATAIDDLSTEEILQVADGDSVRRLPVGSPDYERWLSRFAQSAAPLEWLLFLHPEQSAVVTKDFTGPAHLSGVSGSGKTCVAIHRAIRLASSRPGASVLIVTLNRALAGLIGSLVDAAAQEPAVRDAIFVKSFFQLCQEILERAEPDAKKLYSDVTWKLGEHVDEVFREYFRCWSNNDAAECLLPLHHSLIAQGVCAETYIREEFDWIRSAVACGDRSSYLSMDRRGRRLPLQEEIRATVLEGLGEWERKMREVGVIDYLGLTSAVSRHLAGLTPEYDHVLVDEAQDFGTSEVRVLRALCRPGPNDMFFCGDIAQHVLPKHRSLVEAGVTTAGNNYRITRNYRNSREILEAAYAVLIDNLDVHMLDSEDLVILDPKYASRSSNQPVVLEAESLSAEVGYARTLVRDHLKERPNHRCCIAMAGYSIHEVAGFAAELGVPVLRGEAGPLHEPVVLSDLEQTKGYEFNVMVIVNCRTGVLPPDGTAAEEAFRHGCRLYVAMTRARDELYMSYSGEPAEWLRRSSSALTFMKWEDVVSLDELLVAGPPERLKEAESEQAGVLGLAGRQFLYTPWALGLSLEAIRKVDELVDGVGLIRGKTRVRWRNMSTLLQDLESVGRAQQIFGPVVQGEVRNRLETLRDETKRPAE